MSQEKTIIAIDQGTTSTRAILFGCDGSILTQQTKEFRQIYPQKGWVEHDPEDIWASTLDVLKPVVEEARLIGREPMGIGITNQRETAVIWDRKTGECINNAIVWQDRRTTQVCEALKANGHEDEVKSKTGLLLDPYFTANKFAWILDNVEGARERANCGELCFGTIDSFLVWRLTEGREHLTDATNASRTSLFNIYENCWDDDLLELFNIPKIGLPKVLDCSADFGSVSKSLIGISLPIRALSLAIL